MEYNSGSNRSSNFKQKSAKREADLTGVPNDGFEENPPYSCVLNITQVSLRQSFLTFNFPGEKNICSSPPASRILKFSDSQPALDFEVVNEPAASKFVT